MNHLVLKVLFLSGMLMTSACAPEELNKENSSPDKAAKITLVEEQQRVLRYNCLGQVTSDKIETVKAPTKFVSIRADKEENLYSLQVRNRSMRSYAGLVVNGNGFTIDYNPGLLNLEVDQGLNEISYEFHYCYKLSVPNDPRSTCLDTPRIEESGSIFLDITFNLVDLPGFLELRSTETECRSPTQTRR